MLIEGTLTVSECVFIGDITDEIDARMMVNGREESRNEEVNSEEGNTTTSLCVWESSMVTVNGSNASLISTSSSFINSSYGALSVYDGGEFNGEMVTFMNNNPGLEHFPSMRYNIICFSTVRLLSLVNITSVGAGGDGENVNTSLWINAVENCTIAGIASTYSSAFYIPTLSGIGITREVSGGVITISGAEFVPCELSCTVNADGQFFGVELIALNESVAIGMLSESELEVLEDASSISVQLTSEKGEELTETYSGDIERNGTRARSTLNTDDRNAEGRDSSKVLFIPLSIAFLALLVIVIIAFAYVYVKLKRENVALVEKLGLNAEMEDQKEVEEKPDDEQSGIDCSSFLPPPPSPSPPTISGDEHDTVTETVIVTKSVRVSKAGEGRFPSEIVTPPTPSVHQREIAMLVDNGNDVIERKERERDEKTEHEEGDKKRRKKKKKKKNKQVLNESDTPEEQEEFTDRSYDEMPTRTEESDKEEENEEEEENPKWKKKKKKKKKKKNSQVESV